MRIDQSGAADEKKKWLNFDLPISPGILAASEQTEEAQLENPPTRPDSSPAFRVDFNSPRPAFTGANLNGTVFIQGAFCHVIQGDKYPTGWIAEEAGNAAWKRCVAEAGSKCAAGAALEEFSKDLLPPLV